MGMAGEPVATIPNRSTGVYQDPATIRALTRRSAVLAAVVLPAAALTAMLVQSEARGMRVSDLADRAIPAVLSGAESTWTSTAMQFSDAELEILETRDYMYRTYTDGRGTPVDLCVIFSEDNRKGTHPPEVCLEGSGWRIVQRLDRQTAVAGTALSLRELVTVGGGGQYEYFAYFYKCGDTFTPSFYRQQMQIVWNGLTRRNASGALVRYSTAMAGPMDVSGARARVDELLAATFPHIRDGLSVPQ
jgi:EpsI family protein